jgi:hypothetical protein
MNQAVNVLKLIGEHVPLSSAKNSRFTQQQTYLLLLTMSAMHWFAEGTSNFFAGSVPQADSLFYRLKQQDFDAVQNGFDALIKRNVKLARRLGVLGKRVWIAIDFHDREYYGKPNKCTRGSKPKNGTAVFYSYATASIVQDGCRLMITQLPYLPLDEKAEVVKRLLNECQKLVRVEIALFDRGFFCENVIALLEARRLKYVMPGVRNKRVKKIELQVKHFPSTMDYELKGQLVKLVFIQVKKEQALQTLVFCTNLLCWRNKLAEYYSKRWGIETSYRCVEDFAAKTCSTNSVVRLFLFYFAIALYNAWVMSNAETKQRSHVTGIFLRLQVLALALAAANFLPPP